MGSWIMERRRGRGGRGSGARGGYGNGYGDEQRGGTTMDYCGLGGKRANPHGDMAGLAGRPGMDHDGMYHCIVHCASHWATGL